MLVYMIDHVRLDKLKFGSTRRQIFFFSFLTKNKISSFCSCFEISEEFLSTSLVFLRKLKVFSKVRRKNLYFFPSTSLINKVWKTAIIFGKIFQVFFFPNRHHNLTLWMLRGCYVPFHNEISHLIRGIHAKTLGRIKVKTWFILWN